MRRTRTCVLCSVAWALVVVSSARAQEAPPPGESLLPVTTKGFLSVPDSSHLSEQWDKTQMGQLMSDPVMEPFRTDLRRQFEQRLTRMRRRLGLTLDDLRGVPGGELSLAVIQPGKDQVAMAILIDVTGHLKEANEMLEKVAKNMAEKGAKASQNKVGKTVIQTFTLPKTEGQTTQDQTIYFLQGNLLGGADNLNVIKGILARLDGQQGKSLADVPAFGAVMDRWKKDLGDAKPQLRWFIEPLGYMAAMRTASPEDQRRQGKTIVDIFANQGFTAIRGIGGTLDFSVDDFELLHRTVIDAPGSYEKSMKMFVFPNSSDFAPQDWIPRDVATYGSFYIDVLGAFDNFGFLFDELYGQGETDVWKEVLEGLKEDPNGPQIDLRNKLVAMLSNRVTAVTKYELPITPASERTLYAIVATDAKAVAAAVERLMQNDATVKRHELEGLVIWETVPDETEEYKPPSVSLQLPSAKPKKQPPPPPQGEQNRLFPNAAVTVAHGHLMIASHYDFMTKVLGQTDKRQTLSHSVDYKMVEATFDKLAPDKVAGRLFTRTDQEYRATYELIRQGKMPQAESMFGRILNSLLSEGEPGKPRQQMIDGKKMPEFEVVRRHLGPGGTFAVSEDDGWFLKGFLLKKEVE